MDSPQASLPIPTTVLNSFESIDTNTVDYERKESIYNSINSAERNSIQSFGHDVQEKIGDFTSSILNQVRTKDAGEAGDALVSLVTTLQDWDSKIETPNVINRFLSAIPFVKPLVDKGKKIATEYRSIEQNMSNSKHTITMRSIAIERDNMALDVLFNKQVEYIQEVGDYIAAGYEKHKNIVNVEIPALKAKLGDNPSYGLETQRLNDLTSSAKFLENRVFELNQNRLIATQSLATIRMIQENNAVLAQKMKSALTTMIPLWYTQTAIALCLHRQAKDAAVLKQMGDITNNMLLRNAENLQQTSIAIAKENERSLVDTKVLKEVNGKMIATIQEVIKINEEGKAKRERGANEIKEIEDQLNNVALRAVAGLKSANRELKQFEPNK